MSRPLRCDLRPDDTLFFIHMPKCGGTTLHEILMRPFPPERCLSHDPLHMLLPTLPPEHVASYRFIRAHYGYQVYRLLPRRPFYATMLRDPVQQFISRYAHNKHHQPEKLIQLARDFLPDHPEDTFITLEQYATLPINNIQTRLMAGLTDAEYQAMPASERHTLLPLAKAHLEQVEFIGIMERYDDSLRLLSYTFGWPPIESYVKRNETTYAKPVVTPETEALIRENNPLDLELYAFGRQLFEERMAQMERELEAEHAH